MVNDGNESGSATVAPSNSPDGLLDGGYEVENPDVEAEGDSVTLTRTYPLSPKLEAELEKRFTYHSPQTDQLPRYQAIRGAAQLLARLIARCTPPSREQALALTKLEEAVMHANSGIARESRDDGAPVPASNDPTAEPPASRR